MSGESVACVFIIFCCLMCGVVVVLSFINQKNMRMYSSDMTKPFNCDYHNKQKVLNPGATQWYCHASVDALMLEASHPMHLRLRCERQARSEVRLFLHQLFRYTSLASFIIQKSIFHYIPFILRPIYVCWLWCLSLHFDDHIFCLSCPTGIYPSPIHVDNHILAHQGQSSSCAALASFRCCIAESYSIGRSANSRWGNIFL